MHINSNGISAPTELQKDFDTRIKENFTLVSDVKTNVAQAISDRGVQTSPDATGAQMATNIRAIQSIKTAKGNFNIPIIPIKSTSQDFVTPLMDFEPVYDSTGWGGAIIFWYGERWEGTDAYVSGRVTLRMIKEQVGNQWQVRMRFYNAYNYASSPDTVQYIITN